ncbi:MAG: redoxin domain-containing protein [bacterium]|nr:redoxin domain-containing protein [bacterium]
MNRKIALISAGSIVSLLLILHGCTIDKAPNIANSEYGSVFVTAQDPYNYTLLGAQIYLDGVLQTGKTTPDTIRVDEGNHSIILEKDFFFPDTLMVDVIADSILPASVTMTPVNPDIGKISVVAKDSASGSELDSADIFYDGAATGFFTPDTLENILVGTHLIGVAKTGFGFREIQIEVYAGAMVTDTIAIPNVPFNGYRIQSSISAQISLDDRLIAETTPWIVTGIPDGTHTFSCFKEGYLTEIPALATVQLPFYGSQELTFTLSESPNGVGHDVGQVAPGYALQNIDSDSISLGAYRGRVVLMTFWMLSCQPCMEELPDIEAVYEELYSQGFRVLGVNPADNVTIQSGVRDDLDLTFELLKDQNNAVTLTFLQPPSYPFPTNILIDQSGVIQWYTGSLDYELLKEHVQALLNP